jgi:hypothetical protein
MRREARPRWSVGRQLTLLCAAGCIFLLALYGTAPAGQAGSPRVSWVPARTEQNLTAIARAARHRQRVASAARLRAVRVAPRLTVSGDALRWNPVARIKSYVLRRDVPGQAARYSIVKGTSVIPPPVPGTVVSYSLRTIASRSAWTGELAIRYPASGTGDPRGAELTISDLPAPNIESPIKTSPIEAIKTDPTEVSGDGGGSGAETKAGTEGHSLIVGTVGLAEGGPSQVAAYRSLLHTRYMRLDAGNGVSGWFASDMPAFITEVVTKNDVTPLILYNPAEPSKETLAGRPVGTVRSEVKALGELMHGLGLKWMEFGNEEYFYEQPEEYARQYMAAKEALAGLGITLIADAWGDYLNTENGQGQEYWSQVRDGGGWWVDFANDVKALGGDLPEACSLHPYGPMGGHEYLGAGDGPAGWMSVPAMHQWMVEKHMAVPVWITEVGGETYGTDGEIDTEASLAAQTRQYIENSDSWSYVHALFIYSIRDTPEQGYGLFTADYEPKLAASAFGETVMSLGLSSA